MKILYIGNDETDAQALTSALLGIATEFSVSWSAQLEQAVDWIDENRDVAALVVDADGARATWPSVLKHVREVALRPPVVVMVPQGTLRDLPQVVFTPPLSQLEELIEIERSARARVEQQLARAEAALQDEQRQHQSAMATASAQLADSQAQYEIAMARSTATWEMVDEQLRQAAIEVERSHASAAADRDRLSRREAEVSALVAETKAAHENFERRLADADKALEDARAHAAQVRIADAEAFAERERDLQGEIAEEIDRRSGVEDTLAAAMSAREEADKQHAEAMANAAAKSRELEETLRRTEQDLTSQAADIDRLTEREAELLSKLADADTAYKNLEHRLTVSEAAFHDADLRATRERLASSKRAAEREAELDGQIRQEREIRVALEQAKAAAETALHDAQERHDAAMTTAANELAEQTSTLRAQLSEQAARFEAQSTRERLERESLQEQLTAAGQEQETARRRLEALQAELDGQIRQEREIRATLEQAKAAAETALHDAQERHDAAMTIAANELAEQTSTLRAQLSEQAARLEAQSTRERLERESLQEQLTAAGQEQETARRRLEGLQAEADLLPKLRQQIDESRSESRRLFQLSPLAMFRCTRNGTLREANRACAALVGRRDTGELSGAEFAAAIFEKPAELSWLIEHCLSTGANESIETSWRRKNGGRLVVRLTASRTASDLVEIAVEDLTRVRVLQERLGQAHRMEAVGRLASEVAVTCGSLLGDVHQTAQQWLIMSGGDQASRKQGDLLLEEVNRAAGLLRQLAAYGDEQARTPAMADLNTLMRDLEPVLKRVAGEGVEIQLPPTSSPLNVDVGTERVERLLVNLAAYGRQRMPFGGQLRIELGTIEVDREFTARYPNVRLGSHALITVTENRRAAGEDGLVSVRDGSDKKSISGKPAHRPGVDLRTLQGLVGECGGHLWMKVQPLGDMVAKIRLPLLTSHDQALQHTTVAGSKRGITRWFQH